MARALSPVVGVVLLVGIAVVLSASLGATLAMTDLGTTPVAQLSLEAEATDQRITVEHRGGDTLDVERLRLDVVIAGEPLSHQPPVPFFAADGFEPGPEGPFNVAAEPVFRAGESATFALAGTNEPQLSRGDTVTVTVSTEAATIASLETTAS